MSKKMLENKFKKLIDLSTVLVAMLIISFFTNSSVAKEASSMNIKNSVRAEVNTGGNVTEEENKIKTGDASVSVNANNSINGEEMKVEAEIKAENDNQEVSIKVVDLGKIEIIEGENCEENDNCDISIETENSEKDVSLSVPKKEVGFLEGFLDFFQGLFNKIKT